MIAMLNESGFVEARTKPRFSPPWAGSKTKGGPVTTKFKWTRSAAVGALQEWAKAHEGRAPRQHELRHANPPLPPAHWLVKEFGGLREAVIQAGLPPAAKGGGPRTTRKGKPRHEVENGQPVDAPVMELEPGILTEMERLAAELKVAEWDLSNLRAPYIAARDRVQLLRLEMIELLQDEKEL